MQLGLNDKVALVVGAASELGGDIARRLAAQGANVALADGPDGALASLAADIGRSGGTALAICADLHHPQAAQNCVGQVTQRFGALHILVNALPDPSGLGLDRLSEERFAGALASSLATPFAFIREAVPEMRKQGGGRVVNLSSLRYLGLPGGADIAAAQSGIFGLTRSLALEYAKDQITFNTVVKGDLATPDQDEDDVARLTAGIPAKRLASTGDIAYAVNYFASDASKYVTGQTFFVCGGKSAYFSMSV